MYNNIQIGGGHTDLQRKSVGKSTVSIIQMDGNKII
jgi:hypothetical protein